MDVRRLVNEDAERIEQINPFAALKITYDKGVSRENVVCATDRGNLAGVGFLTLHQTQKADELRVSYDMFMDERYQEDREIRILLTEGMLARFREIQREKSGVRVYLNDYVESDESGDIQFRLERGFLLNAVMPVLRYDLEQEVKHYRIPDDVVIEKIRFDRDTMKAYLYADQLVGEEMNAETDLWFHTGDPTFVCYAAKCRGQIVGSVSVWNISEERGATENIFVIPDYRRKNIARELIAAAFTELKERGLKVATLSVAGRNRPAIQLYLSCGYSLYYNLLEMRYE